MSSTIDAKQRQLIQRFYETIQSGTFDETDVHSLLILLRETVKHGDLVRELADFIAHRNKDRGEVHHYLANIAIKLADKQLLTSDVHEVFTRRKIGDRLNTALYADPLKLDPLDDTIINAVVACILSLLQNIRIVDSEVKNEACCLRKAKRATKKAPKELGILSLRVTHSQLSLWGSARTRNGHTLGFIVFTADYCDSSLASLNSPMTFDRVVEVTCRNRMLRLNQTP